MASRTAIQRTLVCIAAGLAWLASADTYRGVVIAPENRCTPYDRQDYPYSQSVEQRIVAALGKVYGPYSGTCFTSTGETDIEHMVLETRLPRGGNIPGLSKHDKPKEGHSMDFSEQISSEKERRSKERDEAAQILTATTRTLANAGDAASSHRSL